VRVHLLPLRVDVAKMLLRVTQDKDEKGEYDFDATGIRLRSVPFRPEKMKAALAGV